MNPPPCPRCPTGGGIATVVYSVTTLDGLDCRCEICGTEWHAEFPPFVRRQQPTYGTRTADLDQSPLPSGFVYSLKQSRAVFIWWGCVRLLRLERLPAAGRPTKKLVWPDWLKPCAALTARDPRLTLYNALWVAFGHRVGPPTDKIMLSLTAFADELEREKARQRTYDAMIRKAKAGHVTGGTLRPATAISRSSGQTETVTC